MLKAFGVALLSCAFAAATPAALADQNSSSAATGALSQSGQYQTGSGPMGMGGLLANPTVRQAAASLPTYLARLTPGGLPPTRLDSFVKNADENAEMIYGDEGIELPPYFGFTKEHRIGSGINDSGLSTGHGSVLPSAWGAIGESCNSGPNYGGSNNAPRMTMSAPPPPPPMPAPQGTGMNNTSQWDLSSF
ncbi:MAG: hypothetical protein ACRD3W_04170 [Terriglobales bacterium]